MKKYRRMRESDRHKIEALYNAKVPVWKIAEELGFSKVTIYAELKRGSYQHRNHDWTETTKYSAYKAQRDADYNATAKGAQLKIGNDYEFAKFVETMILAGYSPAAVLGFIKDNHLEFKTNVCRVTLYSYIDKGIFRNISNKNLLRKCKKRKYKKIQRAKKLPRLDHSIEKRPKDIQNRTSFGHWELDSVIGTQTKGKTILSFTERMTRMQLVLVAKDKSSASTVSVINGIERKIGSRNFRKIFKSFTCDNGTEFSNTLGMEYSPSGKQRTTVYYCHPYCSSERGSNENQNGFIRRFVPKGTAISRYTSAELKEIQDFINYYPRGIFDYKNSATLFEKELQKLGIEKNSIFF
ncbi:MAG: IS30 family transposase [Clostridia bacterium]|nr:IS30 family transposase [Clostridia bacterium]